MSRILDPGAVGSIPGHMEARWISVDFIHRELLAIAAWKEDAIARFSMGRIKKGGGLEAAPISFGCPDSPSLFGRDFLCAHRCWPSRRSCHYPELSCRRRICS